MDTNSSGAPRLESGARISVEHGRERLIRWEVLNDEERGEALRSHVDAENRYVDESFEALGVTSIAQVLKDEMMATLVDYDSVGGVSGAWSYFTRHSADGRAPSHWRYLTAQGKGSAQLLLDESAQANGGEVSLGTLEVSDNEKLLAVTLDFNGSDKYLLEIRDVNTGAVICFTPEVGQTVLFNSDSSGVYYTRHDGQMRDAYLYFRSFAGSGWVGDEREMYFEQDARYSLGIGVSADKKWVIASSVMSDGDASWLIYRGASDGGELLSLAGRSEEFEASSVDVAEGRVYILSTIGDGEFNAFTAEIDLRAGMSGGLLAPSNSWQSCLKLKEGWVLEGMSVFEGVTAFEIRVGAILRSFIARRGADGMHGAVEELGSAGVIGSQELGDNLEYKVSSIQIIQEGFHPTQTYLAHLNVSGEGPIVSKYELVDTLPIPGFDASRYSSEVVWAESFDRVMIPMAIVKPVGRGIIGTQLFVYGAYGDPYSLEYAASLAALADRGIATAVGFVRGGGEFGRKWYRAARADRKFVTIEDTLACARKLAGMGLGNIDGSAIVIRGGSAGGIAAGGALNAAPNRFAGAVLEVPFVDNLHVMSDASAPLTVGEYVEWGNPVASESEWLNMYRWSVVDNVINAPVYPPVLTTAGLWDTRVGVWEPAKLVLALREGGNLRSWLRTSVDSGHLASSSFATHFKQSSEMSAFVLWSILSREWELTHELVELLERVS